MGTFGIEGIRYFDALRASGVAYADDLTYVFNVCNGLDRELRATGHTRTFYLANNDCWETDLRSTTVGGNDDSWSDNVDLFFIYTHGNHASGNALLAYNVNINNWIGNSSTWHLGNIHIEWLLVYGCHTIDLGNPLSFWQTFQRIHEFCGAWGDMWDGTTTDEVGEDVGDNLTSGDAVNSAWIDGVSDWWVDNHPIVIAAERADTWNGGNPNWSQTTMNLDHLWGHGTTVPDIFPSDKYWLSWRWAEG
jgi:Family of unknown function (DUF6345)